MLVLVEVTDKVKDGDELMALAPGVKLVAHSAFGATNTEDIEDYVHDCSYGLIYDEDLRARG
jgi:hypothetical protein